MHEDKGAANSIQHWYFGDISMEESERLLNTYGEEGDFIVRDSSGVSPYFYCAGSRLQLLRLYLINYTSYPQVN